MLTEKVRMLSMKVPEFTLHDKSVAKGVGDKQKKAEFSPSKLTPAAGNY